MSDEISPLDFLKEVYLNNDLPLSVRMRAAIEAAPYHHPKLSVVATVGDPSAFAAALDRAIARSSTTPKVIEHSPIIKKSQPAT
jgi:hypothetical protein